MSAIIYIEGGGSGQNSKTVTIRCQQAFHSLLDRMGFTGRKPRLKACGGRGFVYEDFRIAHQSRCCNYVAMWIDSEEPMADIESTWNHLSLVTSVAAWEKPDGAVDDQVLLMTTCMETWIAADRAALRTHYGHRLRMTDLPSQTHLEEKSRHDIQKRLESATRDCQNAYIKGKRSFEILEKLDPSAMKQYLPSFIRIVRILNEKL